MHTGARVRTKTHVVSARLTADEKAKLDAKAEAAGIRTAEWVRRHLMLAQEVTQDDRNLPLLTAISSEVQRLTFLAAQDGQDVSSEEIKKIIEDRAVANAPSVVNRWMWKVGQLNG